MSPAFRRVLLLSLLFKVALSLFLSDIQPRYDEVEFLRFGTGIYEAGEAPSAWRAPGYQWFVAAGLWIAGGHTAGVRLLQAVLSVLSSFLVYRIGRKLWGEKAGFTAGIFVAFYPSQVAFSHLLWSETLYGFLALLAFERLLALDENLSWRPAMAAGLSLGAAVLTRSVGLVLLAASLVWILLKKPRLPRLRMMVLVLASSAAAVLPYSIYRSSFHEPVLVDTNGGFNLWSGNNRHIPVDVQGVWALGLPQQNGTDPELARFLPDDRWRNEVRRQLIRDGVRDPQGPEGDRWYRRRALETIRGDPTGFIARIPKKLAAFWAPDFFLPRHLVRDWYGTTSPWLALALVALTWAAAAVPLLVGPAALACLSRTRFRSLILLWLVSYLAVHAVAYGHSRMHQPLVPLLILAVAGAFLSRERLPGWDRVIPRCAPWAVLALAAWIVAIPVVGGLYVAPGPRHAVTARALGSLRHLPLPGARRLAWMLATVEGSLGNRGKADLVLAEGRFADDPWSLYLRSILAESPQEKRRHLLRALEVDPELGAARWALDRLDRRDQRRGPAAP